MTGGGRNDGIRVIAHATMPTIEFWTQAIVNGKANSTEVRRYLLVKVIVLEEAYQPRMKKRIKA